MEILLSLSEKTTNSKRSFLRFWKFYERVSQDSPFICTYIYIYIQIYTHISMWRNKCVFCHSCPPRSHIQVCTWARSPLETTMVDQSHEQQGYLMAIWKMSSFSRTKPKGLSVSLFFNAKKGTFFEGCLFKDTTITWWNLAFFFMKILVHCFKFKVLAATSRACSWAMIFGCKSTPTVEDFMEKRS